METCICQFYIYCTKGRIALQVSRKIAPCDRAFRKKEVQLLGSVKLIEKLNGV